MRKSNLYDQASEWTIHIPNYMKKKRSEKLNQPNVGIGRLLWVVESRCKVSEVQLQRHLWQPDKFAEVPSTIEEESSLVLTTTAVAEEEEIRVLPLVVGVAVVVVVEVVLDVVVVVSTSCSVTSSVVVARVIGVEKEKSCTFEEKII